MANTIVADRAQHLALLKEHLAAAQNRMKLFANSKRRPREFQLGEQVLLKLQPYVQSTVVNRPFPKLSFKYFGPYCVLELVGTATYRLELPEGCQVHPVIHVSQLKEFHADHTPVFTDITTLVDLTSKNLVPEAVLDCRLVKRGNAAVTQVLIKWSHLPASSATWEDYFVLKNRFPTAVAW
ncbi:hypothetical protein BS78_K161100 [Paspalum vaginatum]|uniref:Chromo domain-containing protein n=1 Tax=Paspalum vaginatum TaxID=158149 RepID=A0A9W7X7R8_9POAL|nr:hypothetical protein BS78_K161100 [Paspalum vaginatum]